MYLISQQTLLKLHAAFEAWLIAEVKDHGGIPDLPVEETILRDAVAALLEEAFVKKASVQSSATKE